MELKPGQRLLHEIISKRELSQEDKDKLITIAMEIDELYDLILQNQANFGVPKIFIKDEKLLNEVKEESQS